MTAGPQTFGEFGQAGWNDASVTATYDQRLSHVTTQSVDALLDAADMRRGTRVLGVATGASYLAAAAAKRGADAVRLDFSAAQIRLPVQRIPAFASKKATTKKVRGSAGRSASCRHRLCSTRVLHCAPRWSLDHVDHDHSPAVRPESSRRGGSQARGNDRAQLHPGGDRGENRRARAGIGVPRACRATLRRDRGLRQNDSVE